MKKLSKKSLIISVLAILLIGFTALVIHNYKNKTSFKYFGKTAEELKPDSTKEQDLVNQELLLYAIQGFKEKFGILNLNLK